MATADAKYDMIRFFQLRLRLHTLRCVSQSQGAHRRNKQVQIFGKVDGPGHDTSYAQRSG